MGQAFGAIALVADGAADDLSEIDRGSEQATQRVAGHDHAASSPEPTHWDGRSDP